MGVEAVGSGRGGITDADVHAASKALAAALALARDARVGAGVPDVVLTELSTAIEAGDEFTRRLHTEPTRVATEVALLFLTEHSRCALQWVEMSYQIIKMDSARDQIIWRYRHHCREVIVGAKILAGKQASATYPTRRLALLEFEAMLLGCELALALRNRPPDEGALSGRPGRAIRKRAHRLVSRVNALADVDDPNRVFGWSMVAAARALSVCGEETAAAQARALAWRDAYRDHHLLMNLLMTELDPALPTPRLLESVRRLDTILLTQPDPMYSPVRAGYVARVRHHYTGVIAALAERPDELSRQGAAQCVRAMTCWWTRQQHPLQDTVCHTFVSGTDVVALIEHRGQVEVVTAPLPRATIRQLLEISLKPPTDEVLIFRPLRETLSASLTPILDALAAHDRVRINSLGFTGWIPWETLKYRGGTLIGARGIARFHPHHRAIEQREPDPTSPPRVERVCIIADRAVELPAAVSKVFRALPVSLMEFDSESDTAALTIEQIRGAARPGTALVLFCHTRSDVFDYARAGIKASASSALGLGELSCLDLTATPWAVVVACESGRANTFTPATSVAHALAYAGVATVAGTLWEIAAKTVGPQFLKQLLKALNTDPDDLARAVTTCVSADPTRMMPFSLISS
ncbi:CHAT domain-containing protein [Nocardia aurantiaca]|uniref:CHAT domain-containing protein n=1 Tax=Nocardia aurantiaca TaxID=2675850 RepID=UPI0018AAA003|nr:CHAT domain-containing protein [Nocardia aurantiaca]